MPLTRTLFGRRSLVFATLTLLTTVLLLALPQSGLAQPAEEEPQPQPAYRFYGFPGSVTIDGEPAPHGTVIEAWADGEIVGRGLVRHGAWNVDVDYLSSGVTFTVNGYPDMGEPRDALVRGGQARMSLAAVTPAPDSPEEVVEVEDDNGTEMELESECPDTDEMMGSDEGIMSEDCPDEGDDLMEEIEVAEELADEEETTDFGFPNSGGASLSRGESGAALVAGIVFGIVVLGVVAGGVFVRRRLRPSSRV